MTERFCLHEGITTASIGFIHSCYIPCEQAVKFFRVADKIWKRICARYGRGEIEFWVLLYYDQESPVIASCSGNSVFFNFGRLRTNLTLEQDVASRLIEELYHLHEWRVRGIEPDVPERHEKIVLTPEELVAYYSLDHKYHALQALVEMTNIAYWEELLAKVEAHRASQGL